MDARKRVVQLGIRLLKFEEIACNRLESSSRSLNFYRSMSSNLSGHQSDNKQIYELVKPIEKGVNHDDTLARIQMEREAKYLKFKSDIQSYQAHRTEKIRNEIKNLHGDLCKIRAHIHATKNEVGKYFIGSFGFVFLFTVGIIAYGEVNNI